MPLIIVILLVALLAATVGHSDETPAPVVAVAPVAAPVVDGVAQCHADGYEYCTLDEAAASIPKDEAWTKAHPIHVAPGPPPAKGGRGRRMRFRL